MTQRLRSALAQRTHPAKTLSARAAAAMQSIQHGMQLNQASSASEFSSHSSAYHGESQYIP